MKLPLVSVVINCFNGEAFLRQAIDSVIAQSYCNWEIIFWDNQSTDASAAIVKAYDDPRILYFYAPTHTILYEARNYAIERASGELLAFLDVDDWWLPKKLELQVAFFSDSEVAVVYGNYWILNECKGKKWLAYKNSLPSGYILDSLLENYSVGLLTLMLRKSHLPSNKQPFNPSFHIIGDFDLVIRLASKGKVACAQEPVAVYRIHGSNESILRKNMHLDEVERWCDEMSNEIKISKSKNFIQVRLHAQYTKIIGLLINGKRFDAAKNFFPMRWGKFKFKLLIALVLPKIVISRIKN